MRDQDKRDFEAVLDKFFSGLKNAIADEKGIKGEENSLGREFNIFVEALKGALKAYREILKQADNDEEVSGKTLRAMLRVETKIEEAMLWGFAAESRLEIDLEEKNLKEKNLKEKNLKEK